jgi:hypothetical protein
MVPQTRVIWPLRLRGNYQFADDYDAIIGNAGLRYAW